MTVPGDGAGSTSVSLPLPPANVSGGAPAPVVSVSLPGPSDAVTLVARGQSAAVGPAAVQPPAGAGGLMTMGKTSARWTVPAAPLTVSAFAPSSPVYVAVGDTAGSNASVPADATPPPHVPSAAQPTAVAAIARPTRPAGPRTLISPSTVGADATPRGAPRGAGVRGRAAVVWISALAGSRAGGYRPATFSEKGTAT